MTGRSQSVQSERRTLCGKLSLVAAKVRIVSLYALALVASFWSLPGNAHEVRPAYLEITEQTGGAYRVMWKQPLLGDAGVSLKPVMSGGWLAGPARFSRNPDYLVLAWTIPPTAPRLAGQTIGVDGLERTITDTLVRMQDADGNVSTVILTPDRPGITLDRARPASSVRSYFGLGVEHILTGPDHLLFVCGLLLIAGGWRRVTITITAFTAAHSITLAAAALGLVALPVDLIEALIVLSILFVGVEASNARLGRPGWGSRRPWLVACAFGLLHGFGFASALTAVGLPPQDTIPALLFFNVGVEVGQLCFVAAVLAATRLLSVALPAHVGRLYRPATYLIGGTAAFWFMERAATALAS
jgi:hydrogenase/urease accessory protein HupE